VSIDLLTAHDKVRTIRTDAPFLEPKPGVKTGYKLFTVESIEHELNKLRSEKKLILEDITVKEIINTGQVQQAVLKIPSHTIHPKTLDVVRMWLWNKGNGIAVVFDKNPYIPTSKVSANKDYFTIIEKEFK